MASFSDSDVEKFEVAEILDSRKRGRTLEYLVKWKDYDSGDETWEPAKNLKGADEAIKVYEQKKVTKSPARSSRRTQQVQKEQVVSRQSGRNVTRKTTVTTVETRTVTGTQSESSSPENSPKLTRRRITSTVTTSTASKSAPDSSTSSRLPGVGILQLDSVHLPLVILFVSFLFIALTFVVATPKK